LNPPRISPKKVRDSWLGRGISHAVRDSPSLSVRRASAIDLAKELSAYGLENIIYTDISRDGTLSGVNVEATAKLALESGVNIIASGGVRSLEDIHSLKAREADGIIGVIAGKSIYEGTLSLPEAIAAAR